MSKLREVGLKQSGQVISLDPTGVPAPPGWQWVKLSSVARLESGHTPSRKVPSYWNGGIPWIGIKDAREHHGKVILKTLQTISQEGLDNSSARLLPKGTVCLSRTASVGYALITGKPMATSQDFVNWIPSKAIEAKFLMFLFIAEKDSILGFGKGSTHKTIYFTEVQAIHICLPPRNEQRRIIRKIESLRARSERARASLNAIPPLIDQFREVVLAAAFRGDLTAIWREQNVVVKSASELLIQIRVQRRRHWEDRELARLSAKGRPPINEEWKKRYKEPASFDHLIVSPIPESWAWTSLDTISYLKGGLAKGKKRPRGERLRRVPYLRVANVQRGYLDLREVLDIEATKEEIEELLLRNGDVLFIEGGDRDKLGRGWIWESQLPECIHQNHVFRARLVDQDAFPELVSHYANSQGQSYFFAEGRQTTNLASLSLAKLASLPVPLLPTGEAGQLCLILRSAFATIDLTWSKVKATLGQVDSLDGAVLEKAFRGMLVDQDPKDEPVAKLLARLAKRLSASTTAKATRKIRQAPLKKEENAMRVPLPITDTHLRDTIKAHGGSMNPRDLWQASSFAGDIDAFYAQLRQEIDRGILREVRSSTSSRIVEVSK